MKKYLSIIIAVLMLLSFSSAAFAGAYDEIPATECDVSTPDCAATETETRQYSASYGSDEQSIDAETNGLFDRSSTAAKMYLCFSHPYDKYIFGHVWIVIENTGTRTLRVADLEIQPGDIGTFGLHHFDGLHINDEKAIFRGRSVKALEVTVSYEQIEEIDTEMCSARWHRYEYFTHNCTNFVSAIWKIATGRGFFVFCFPFIIAIQMSGAITVTL